MLEDEPGSKRPLSMISFEMNTTSRRTANRCSFKPRIISPSTNAAAGAFLISSLIPQACLTIRISKSLYFSKMRRVSSSSLPELRTASAHLRNSGYRPRGAVHSGYYGQAVQRRRRPSPCQPFGTGQISPHAALSPPYWVHTQLRRLRLAWGEICRGRGHAEYSDRLLDAAAAVHEERHAG